MTSAQDRIERRPAPDQAGIRLDTFLSRQPEVGSRSRARQIVDRDAVTVDGNSAKASTSLEAGQCVSFLPIPERDETGLGPVSSWPFALQILYEDSHVLVIDKPVGLVAHRPERHRRPQPSVAELALHHCGSLSMVLGDQRPGVVHRLDRDTSGVMVLAKTDEASHFLRSQFKARTVRKEYRAIAFGEPRFDSDFIERAIAPHPRMPERMVTVPEGGKKASTFYEVVESFAGFTHFRCLPKTGRTHQIRVHMTSIGHSLVGDRIYRSRNHSVAGLPAEAPDPGRQCLHALRLGFRHPWTHEDLSFDAPLPDDMKGLLGWLRVHRARD